MRAQPNHYFHRQISIIVPDGTITIPIKIGPWKPHSNRQIVPFQGDSTTITVDV